MAIKIDQSSSDDGFRDCLATVTAHRLALTVDHHSVMHPWRNRQATVKTGRFGRGRQFRGKRFGRGNRHATWSTVWLERITPDWALTIRYLRDSTDFVQIVSLADFEHQIPVPRQRQ